jgi:hypothetical protein
MKINDSAILVRVITRHWGIQDKYLVIHYKEILTINLFMTNKNVEYKEDANQLKIQNSLPLDKKYRRLLCQR